MATTTETTADRLERIRSSVALPGQVDCDWLCDTLQGFLDEREEVRLALLRSKLAKVKQHAGTSDARIEPADHFPTLGER